MPCSCDCNIIEAKRILQLCKIKSTGLKKVVQNKKYFLKSVTKNQLRVPEFVTVRAIFGQFKKIRKFLFDTIIDALPMVSTIQD